MSQGDYAQAVARAYRSTALSFSAATQKVPLDAVDAGDDPAGFFDPTTNHRYNVKVPGVYRVAAVVSALSTGSGTQYCAAAIYRNGAVDTWGSLASVTSLVADMISVAAATVVCSANDYLELWAQANGTFAVVTGRPFTTLSVQRIA